MSKNAANVDAYLQSLEPDRKMVLEHLRAMVFEVVPDAVETMDYRMPTYQYNNDMLCAFASQKHYISLYMNTDVVAQHADDLKGLSTGKSCIRFKKLEKLPQDTIKQMLQETADRLKR